MLGVIQLILQRQILKLKQSQKSGGFTMIELLVALVIAVIMVSSLLGFVVDLLNNDRREQAKSISEQEVQTALNYISEDLSQAVFIYDVYGIYGGTPGGSVPALVGLQQPINSLPRIAPLTANSPNEQRVPVLAFWKRSFLTRDQTINTRRVGSLSFLPPFNTQQPNNQDYQVYSLVVYYLVRDNPTCNSPTWSCTTRISRVEIRDGVQDPGPSRRNPAYPLITRNEGGTPAVTNSYILPPSPGFRRFNLSDPGSNLREKMDQWFSVNLSANDQIQSQANQPQVLLDYVDQTPVAANSPSQCGVNEQRIPPAASTPTTVAPAFVTNGFYACVYFDPNNPTSPTNNRTAQVFIRGNALARISSRTNPPEFSDGQAAFFPSSNIRVQSRGFLVVE